MTVMSVADSSALYAVMNPDDAHHEKARADLAKLSFLVIPAEVFAETTQLLVYRLGHETGRQAATALRDHPQVEIQPSWDDPWDNILDEAWQAFGEGVNRSYVDCIVYGWCKKRELPLWTYDESLRKACK